MPINGFVLIPAIGLSANLTTVGILRGGTLDIPVTVFREQGFAGPVDLSIDGLPSGVTAVVTPATVPAGATTASLRLSVSASAPTGTTTATLRGKGGNVADAELGITIHVNP